MENTPRRSRARILYLPVLAVAVAMVAAVTSWAANPVGSASPTQSAAPFTQQIQDTETTPATPGDEGGRPEDCPKGGGPGGRGDGDGDGSSGSAAPQSAPDTAAPPTTQTQTEV